MLVRNPEIAEHGGFNIDDTNVGLVVSNPQLDGGKIVYSQWKPHRLRQPFSKRPAHQS